MKRPRRDESRLVYSTETGRQRTRGDLPPNSGERSAQSRKPGDGTISIRRQSKGRGGKTVTIVEGLPGSDSELRERAKALKRHCGVGGAVKDGCIEIQGDQRERLADLLRAEGHPVKLAGG